MEQENIVEILEDIIETPQLTQEEWDVVNKATPWVKATIRPEVLLELEEKFVLREVEWRSEQEKIMRKSVEEAMEKWRKDQEPLSAEDIAKLLNQDYIEHVVPLKIRGVKEIRNFTICELPQEAELKFISVFQKSLIPLLQEVASAEFTLDNTMSEQLKSILNKTPAALSLVRELVAICLDPWDEDKSINADWVKKNLSSTRQEHILTAQVEANRYRDFFSRGSQLYRSLTKR